MGKEDEKSKEEKTKRKDLPFEVRKGAEYHKPPDRNDSPPPPSPPSKEESDKD